jgi:type I restriction enzyme S subunit
MREMKDSGVEWIGQIPKEWELRRAKTLFTQRNSKGNEIEVLLSPTQKYGVVPQSQLEGVVQVKEDTDLQMFKTVHKGDFVISLRSFQGGFEYSLYEGVCSPAYQVFYPTSPICDTYYRYLFKSQSFISKMNNLTVGIREGKNIQYVDFANSQIPVPPLAEQERIAAFLDAECAEIDAVLEKTRASIEEYKKLKQAVITQAVTKGIRGDRPMKDSGIEWIGEIPAEWEIRKIFRAINKVGDIDHYMPDSVDDGIPYLMTGDLQEKLSDVNLKRCKKVSFQDYEMLSSKIRVSKGDVIFARYATIGTVCFVDTEDNILVSYACLIIKPNSSLLYGEFLFYYLKSTAFLEEIKQYIKANTQANVGLDSVSKAKIALPSVHEQQKIVEYLRDKCKKIDALIAKKQQYLTEIENYKKSLIYEYVTGKKEVV